MTFRVSVHGLEVPDTVRGPLTEDDVAARLVGKDATLWGPEAESESAVRLGWLDLPATSRELVSRLAELRAELADEGLDRIVLCGMGGSSLAPEVICRTAGVPLVVLDTTDPGQVAGAMTDLDRTVVVVSSKSGGTVETDSQRRAFISAFADAGLDDKEIGRRFVVVTDPGSPLSETAAAMGARAVFLADPNVGGRYSALSAFGLVPSALAGADVAALLDDAEELAGTLAEPGNAALELGTALGAGFRAGRDKLALAGRSEQGSGPELIGFGDWAEQLIAESTGKEGTGILPVVLDIDSPELGENLPDLQIVRLVDDAGDEIFGHDDSGEIRVSGTLGAQLLVWEYATVVAGRILGINPFDQPDVESAKIAARGLLDARPEPAPAAFVTDGIEVRGTPEVIGASSDLVSAIEVLLEELPADGYLSVHAYVDRVAHPDLERIRDLLAARAGRPVTFGWGPRFLHSTGQFHKGGPAVGVFLQITQTPARDLEIPDRPFTFGELIAAQASGDSAVLADHGRPVLTLTLTDPASNIATLFDAVG